jgi:hypothetical protein
VGESPITQFHLVVVGESPITIAASSVSKVVGHGFAFVLVGVAHLVAMK